MTAKNAEAWILIPREEEFRSGARPGRGSSYNYGFVAAMGRLLAAHSEIGPLVQALFRQIMFTPGSLSRQEREMLAAVAAAAQQCHY